MNSGDFFARKFSTKTDSAVIDKIFATLSAEADKSA